MSTAATRAPAEANFLLSKRVAELEREVAELRRLIEQANIFRGFHPCSEPPLGLPPS